jgi:hypothetical protein
MDTSKKTEIKKLLKERDDISDKINEFMERDNFEYDSCGRINNDTQIGLKNTRHKAEIIDNKLESYPRSDLEEVASEYYASKKKVTKRKRK